MEILRPLINISAVATDRNFSRMILKEGTDYIDSVRLIGVYLEVSPEPRIFRNNSLRDFQTFSNNFKLQNNERPSSQTTAKTSRKRG